MIQFLINSRSKNNLQLIYKMGYIGIAIYKFEENFMSVPVNLTTANGLYCWEIIMRLSKLKKIRVYLCLIMQLQ